MSDLKICRICLRIDGKMYKYDKFQLKHYYEQIISIKIVKGDNLPQCFCWECAAILHKFYKFKEKCHTGQKLLKEMAKPISLLTISKILKENTNLKSSLAIIEADEKVETFIWRHEVERQSPTPERIQEVIIPIYGNALVKSDSDDCGFDNDSNDGPITEEDTEAKTDQMNDVDIIHSEKIVSEKLLENGELISESERDKVDLAINNKPKKRKNEITAKSKKKRKLKENKSDFDDKFQSTVKKKTFDSDNWEKVCLTEEEAAKQFKARAEDQKYLKAPFKCTDCLRGFSKEDMLKRHVKLRHIQSLGSMECRFCHMRFKWNSLLNRHIREHFSRYKCLRCDLSFALEWTAYQHDQYHNGVTRVCEHCNQEFTHLSTYYTHLRKHRSKHLCTFCGESFVSEFGLNMHRKIKHLVMNEDQTVNSEEITFCAKCDIVFETRKAYEEHLIHSTMHLRDLEEEEEGPTGLNLKAGTKLRRAPRKHTTCAICNRNFSTLVAYTKHHLSEHAGTPLPAVANSGSQPQERHICEICGASLAANSIAHHLNTHTREKLYTCTTCGMQFNSRTILTRHHLTHTGEKPVECPMCDKRFTQSASMKLHYRTIHLKQPYPKRNRKKKTEDTQESTLLAEYYKNKEDPEDSIALSRWRTFK